MSLFFYVQWIKKSVTRSTQSRNDVVERSLQPVAVDMIFGSGGKLRRIQEISYRYAYLAYTHFQNTPDLGHYISKGPYSKLRNHNPYS